MLTAGAAAVDITPETSQFLQGYPHVERYSAGVHDPLFSSALALGHDGATLLFVANDILYVTRRWVERIRRRLSEEAGIAPEHVMVTATHTHSAPVCIRSLSCEADRTLPPPDPAYMQQLEDGIVQAGREALEGRVPAELGLARANAVGIGTHRRNPSGPSDPEVPVLLVRDVEHRRPLACMLVCSMHPTVLHEDSTLVSGDFPAMARLHLQRGPMGTACPVLHHTGPAGNQSPRHVTRNNTFAEAERLGRVLGEAVERVLPEMHFTRNVALRCARTFVELPGKAFPKIEEAEDDLQKAVERLERLRRENAPRQDVRTAECDWFGAEERLTLARAATDGRLQETMRSFLPAEIQVFGVGPWRFAAWQGEIFVEYALEVKRRFGNTFVLSLANGETQGYIVTPEAAAEGGYEADNGLLHPDAGSILVRETGALLKNLSAPGGCGEDGC